MESVNYQNSEGVLRRLIFEYPAIAPIVVTMPVE